MVDMKAEVTVDTVMEVHMVLLQQISKIKGMELMELIKGKPNSKELDEAPIMAMWIWSRSTWNWM